MQKFSLMIRRFPYEEPDHLNLLISVENGEFSGSLEYYCNTADLAQSGNALINFPRTTPDEYIYEIGSPRAKDRWAYHLVLRAYTLDFSGHCALSVVINNNQPPPDEGACSFSIRVEPNAINRLGRLLRTFAELRHMELRWTDEEGELLAENDLLNQ